MHLLTLSVVAAALVLPGAPEDAGRTAGEARLGAHLRVELLTMGPGAETYSRFGHSALRVTDLRGVGDIVFNFGTFDHEDPAVVSKFLAGTLQYWLSVSTYLETRKEYQSEGRRLIAQELRLTSLQRRRLFIRLYAMSQPDKRRYRYHHYHANCATRIRDVLDEVMGGSLRRQLSGRPAHTYRRWLRRATRGAPLFHLGFDLVLTRADARISSWEACFTPEQLMRAMEVTRVTAPTTADPGSGSPGKPQAFVAKTRVLLPGPAFGDHGGPAPWTLAVLLAYVLLALALVPLVIRPSKDWAWRLSGVALGLWGVVTTALSGLLMYVWSISDLPVFTGNQNLFLLPPTGLAWIVAGVALVVRPPCRRCRGRWLGRWLGRGLGALAGLHALMALLYGGARVLGFANQGNNAVLAIVIPWTMATIWIVHRARCVAPSAPDAPGPVQPGG